jgi:hypothetical protein
MRRTPGLLTGDYVSILSGLMKVRKKGCHKSKAGRAESAAES